MIVLLSSKIVKARLNHKCNYCFISILKGELYSRSGLVYEGKVYSWTSHLRCDKIASKLGMFDECDGGLTGDVFQEIINNEFHKLHKGEEDYNIPEFSEILDFVCKHHKIN